MPKFTREQPAGRTPLPNWMRSLDSGNYTLAADYLSNFVINNVGSPENMFVVPFDEVFLPGFNLHVMTLHYASQATYNFQAQPGTDGRVLRNCMNPISIRHKIPGRKKKFGV